MDSIQPIYQKSTRRVHLDIIGRALSIGANVKITKQGKSWQVTANKTVIIKANYDPYEVLTVAEMIHSKLVGRGIFPPATRTQSTPVRKAHPSKRKYA